MSSGAITRYKHALERAHASTKRAREKAGEVMQTAIDASLSSGTAFAFGIWNGRVGERKEYELFGVPAPLLAAVAAHGAAVMGVGRGMEGHLRSIGNGALSAHLFGIGSEMGKQWRLTGKFDGGRQTLSGQGPTANDLSNFAR